MKLIRAFVQTTIYCSLFQIGSPDFLQAQGNNKAITIQIRANKPANFTIPRTIFGSFLEPIGNSTYNGLWAEILQNPSFEENLWSVENVERMVKEEPSLRKASQLGLPLPWEPLDEHQGNRYEPRWKEAANSWRSLEIIGVPGQDTGVKQKVFLPVQRELQYRGSIYAKHLSGPADLEISLRARIHPDLVLTKATIAASSSDWTKYQFELSVPTGIVKVLDPLDFVVQVAGDERVLIDQASLMPADAIDGLDPDMVKMAKEMNTPLVRFGGNFTSGYHWRDGIGERDKRVSELNIAWGIPEYNQFGTDEFLHFCDLIGAEPQVALNLGSGTPSEAADWVKYVDEHLATHTGHLWELGNELWGTWNLGNPTLQEVAARTLAFSQAVRSADPKAQLIATGEDPDHFQKWNAAQLSNPPGTFDLLSTHFVVTTTNIVNQGSSLETMASAALALPVELGRKLREMQAQINHTPGDKNQVHLAFTEWLFHPGPKEHTFVSYSNLGGALAAGGMFNMLLQNGDIVPVSDMTGIIEFAGIWKKRGLVYATPSYYVFKMYATAAADRLVDVKTNAKHFNVEEGISRFPAIHDVPYLDTVAALSKDGDRLTLLCVNRDLNADTPAEIDISDFTAATEAKVQVLSSPSIYDENDETKPRSIVPMESTTPVEGKKFSYTFRHASVTRIEMARQP